jgi:transposase InsO family protein
VWTASGFCYVSFITDVYSRRILGRRASMSKTTDLVTAALAQALSVRRRTSSGFTARGLIHHSDAVRNTRRWHSPTSSPRPGSPVRSARSVTRWTTRSWNPRSVSYKTELIEPGARRRNWAGLREVERETAEWVRWYNHERIHWCGVWQSCGRM